MTRADKKGRIGAGSRGGSAGNEADDGDELVGFAAGQLDCDEVDGEDQAEMNRPLKRSREAAASGSQDPMGTAARAPNEAGTKDHRSGADPAADGVPTPSHGTVEPLTLRSFDLRVRTFPDTVFPCFEVPTGRRGPAKDPSEDAFNVPSVLGLEAGARWPKKGAPVLSRLLSSAPESAAKELQLTDLSAANLGLHSIAHLGGPPACAGQLSGLTPGVAPVVEPTIGSAPAALPGQIDIAPPVHVAVSGVQMSAPAKASMADAAATIASVPFASATALFAPSEVALSGRASGSVVTDDRRAAATELKDCLEQQDVAHRSRMRLRATVLPVLERVENDREALSMEVHRLQLLLHEERVKNEGLQKSVNDSHGDKAIFLSSLLPILLLWKVCL